MKLTSVHKELLSIGAGLLALGVVTTAFAAQAITVVQHDRRFNTASVDMAVGDEIHFTNEDDFIHQLYAESSDFRFNSEEQPRGKILTVPFTVAGTFEIRCRIHPKMLLTVNVK